MKESLFDKCTSSLGLVDFRKPTGSRGGKASEASRYLAALKRIGEREGRELFDKSELQAVAGEIRLNVKDVASFIDHLNDAGEQGSHLCGKP